MFCSRPDPFAAAAAIARLPTKDSVSACNRGVLNDEFGLSRAEPFHISFKPIAPFRIRTVDLVARGEESRFHVDSPCCIGLANVELEPHIPVQGLERNIFGYIGSIQPVDFDLVLFRRSRAGRTCTLRQSTW